MADYLKTGRVFDSPDAKIAAFDAPRPVGKAAAPGTSLFAAKSLDSLQRRADASARQRAYEDQYRAVLAKRISETFAAANVEELLKVLDTTNNPLKRIVNEISVLYTKPPARKLATSTASATWREVLARAGAGVIFPRLNRMVTLHNTALLYVRPGYDSLTLRVVRPQDCEVTPDPDDPTMPFCVEFAEIGPSGKPIYHQWERREGVAGFRLFDDTGKIIGDVGENPYFDGARQIVPFIGFHREWRETFWDCTSGDDIYELSIMVGMWETWINHLLKTDATRQKWASGQLDAQGQPTGGPTSIMSLRNPEGGPVSVGEFSSQADWDGLGAQNKRKLENVLNNCGLVLPDTRTSGDPTSGFALMVRGAGLVKIQAAQMPSYEASERTTYRVVASVWNFERENGEYPEIGATKIAALPPIAEAKPTIRYADLESAKTVEEKQAELDMAEKEIRLGLASPITVYMDRHPEATEDEAKVAIEKNRADSTDDAADEVDPTTALNGAQVAALIEVVKSVAGRELPRETGVEIIVGSFPVDRETAERLMGPAGRTFFVDAAPQPTGIVVPGSVGGGPRPRAGSESFSPKPATPEPPAVGGETAPKDEEVPPAPE